MNPNTLELITKELTELNQLRLFKSKMVEKLFGDLPLASYKPDDEDIFNCVQGFKNLSTGWDEEDEDGDIDILAYHHPSYNQLKEKASKLSTGLVGGGIIPLKKENDELRLKVDALEKTIVEQKEDIQQYKDTLDEHLHHYDLLKDKSQKIETINTELYQKTAELKTLLDKATGGGEKQLMKMFKFFKEENKKLKKELEKLETHLSESEHELYILKRDAELKEENKILINYQTSIAEIEKWSHGELEDIVDILPKLKELKEENKELIANFKLVVQSTGIPVDDCDLLKELKEKHDELKANFQVVWEVLGESSYADELNKRLFPENFEEDEEEKVKKKFLERHNITEEEMVEMMKKSCGISPEEEVNCHKCKELGTNDSKCGGATDENDISICDDCYDEWDCQ